MFGDGDTATGSVVEHTFIAAGSYTVSLKVADITGAFHRQTLPISVTKPTSVNSPPSAVLSSSASVGNAPLPVQFDGTGSSDSDGSIISHSWDLGDGGVASTPKVDHTYISSGTFYSSLTVTDNGGLKDSVSTPVLVQPATGSNIAPKAVISSSIKKGKVPLSIQFSGRLSNDPDGRIVAYSWNFGDGSTGTGKSVRHNYQQAANYKITLKVTDDQGAVSLPATYSISARTAEDTGEDEKDIKTIQVIINSLLLKSSPQLQPDTQQQ